MTETTHIKCKRCGQPAEGVIGEDCSLCQMCWEAECSEAWWKMLELPATERYEIEAEGGAE